jgi:hypothetical protein
MPFGAASQNCAYVGTDVLGDAVVGAAEVGNDILQIQSE